MNTPLDHMKDFLEFNPREAEKKSTQPPSQVFIKLGQENALKTFKLAAKTVPAYKDFLKKSKVNPSKINTVKDFINIPLTNKKNYLMKYPLKDLLAGGNFLGKSAITSSSGSAGKPLYWPRLPIQDFGATKGIESFAVSNYHIDKKTTLHVNCSGMGVWTAGDYFGLILKYFSYKYSNNTSISPGIDFESTIRILTDLGSSFNQIILYGYPPFIKDLIDNLSQKIIKQSNINVVVYGEPYTESWRQYILKILKAKDKIHTVSSLLGSSEGGLIGIESANCTLIRLDSDKNSKLCLSLFGENRVPSLVQFNPMSKYIEIVGSQLVLTNPGGLPLIRYDTKDYGGILTAEEIDKIYLETFHKSFYESVKEKNIANSKLPFVYLFGRSDYTATIYGVLIFPEMMKDALIKSRLSPIISGKFVMKTEHDNKNNQYLKLICELKKKHQPPKKPLKDIEKIVAESLKNVSSEYAKLYKEIGERVTPRIDFRKYGDSQYFSSKNKQKYIL